MTRAIRAAGVVDPVSVGSSAGIANTDCTIQPTKSETAMKASWGRGDMTRRELVGLPRLLLFVAVAVCVLPQSVVAQLTGTLIGTVKDEQGGAVVGAQVTLSSPALMGGPVTQITDEKGRLRFRPLAPGQYLLEIEMQGFKPYHEELGIGADATIDRTAVLKLAVVEESVVVQEAGPPIEARNPGLWNRFSPADMAAIPTRRTVFDFFRASPGMSPTSPSSVTVTSVSAFGSGTNENSFLFDGTDFTSPSNGAARADPGIDFVQELQVQSVGASAEFGNVQGAVFNIVTRQGSNRFLFDASYHEQMARLTSQPVRLPIPDSGGLESGYERERYDDLTTSLGGPVSRDRLWFFAGYERVRDYDSQPGTDPMHPRTQEQDKIFLKLNWRLAPGLTLMQSFHDEFWVTPQQPTIARPFETTLRQHGTVPAITFGHLTHAASSNTVWEVRVGRFTFSQEDDPSTGDRQVLSTRDQATKLFSGGPPQIGNVTGMRTTAKATLSHYRPAFLGADHEWKVGGQLESGEHRSLRAVPTGVMLVTNNNLPFRSVSSDPSNAGGRVVTAGVFVSDAITLADRVTVNVGWRFDQSRAISQDLPKLDAEGHDTGEMIQGDGTLYTWNIVSPRLGVTAKLDEEGRTRLRASYGRYSQGVQTGDISPLHPGVTPVTTRDFVVRDGDYTRIRSVVDGNNLQLDADIRSPRTDQYSVGVDREFGHQLAVAISYVRKRGSGYIGWKDVGGLYENTEALLADGSSLSVSQLVDKSPPRLFQLTNPEDYFLTYNGLVIDIHKRWSNGWQASGSYTASRAFGLQASSGTTAAGEQVTTVGAPPILFGRDPNDLINAIGRLPNDRPHVLRAVGTADVPHTGVVITAHFQYFSGKPWAATALVELPPPQSAEQRVLLEPRGSRRLPSQTLLDVRVSKAISFGGRARVDLILDVLNALNDAAAEGLVTDNYFNIKMNSVQPNIFMDPRRVMLGVRLHLGR